ncbi:MAG TPA: hypothetical protein VH044_11505, partial [Polyangiaceae bacterium]|nr:hypothetical protein [Polyangiaceae bacterium]
MKTFGPGILVVLGLLPAACFSSTSASPGPHAGAPDSSAPSSDASTGNDASTAPDAAAPDGAVVDECPIPTGPGTTHQSVNADETWTAAGSPHTLLSDSTIYATLTLEPCARILLDAGRLVTVRGNGAIVAHGTPTRHIRIARQTAGAAYGPIRSLGRPIDLAYVDIDGGGAPGNTNAYLTGALDIQGADATMPTQPLLAVDHVTITGSGSNGVSLYDGAGFATGSTELTIQGAAQYPIGMWSRAVDGVPTGHYTGNTHDEIMLYG